MVLVVVFPTGGVMTYGRLEVAGGTLVAVGPAVAVGTCASVRVDAVGACAVRARVGGAFVDVGLAVGPAVAVGTFAQGQARAHAVLGAGAMAVARRWLAIDGVGTAETVAGEAAVARARK